MNQAKELWDKIGDEQRALLKYSSEKPVILSVLYDLNLLPEQLQPESQDGIK